MGEMSSPARVTGLTSISGVARRSRNLEERKRILQLAVSSEQLSVLALLSGDEIDPSHAAIDFDRNRVGTIYRIRMSGDGELMQFSQFDRFSY